MLEGLKKDNLAAASPLYLISDGPREQDKEQVLAVRDYLCTVTGFKYIKHIYFDRNDRSQIWEKRREICSQYGKYIFLEEDCVPYNGLLYFLNKGLLQYQDDSSVFAICGYVPPVKGINDLKRLYRVPSFNVWGFGSWARATLPVQETITPTEYNDYLYSADFLRRVNKSFSMLYLAELKRVAQNDLLAFDIMSRLHVLNKGMYSIYPPGSLVQNIGFDGSGQHCGNTHRFNVKIRNLDPSCFDYKKPIVSKLVIDEFAKFYGKCMKNTFRFYWKRCRGKMKC